MWSSSGRWAHRSLRRRRLLAGAGPPLRSRHWRRSTRTSATAAPHQQLVTVRLRPNSLPAAVPRRLYLVVQAAAPAAASGPGTTARAVPLRRLSMPVPLSSIGRELGKERSSCRERRGLPNPQLGPQPAGVRVRSKFPGRALTRSNPTRARDFSQLLPPPPLPSAPSAPAAVPAAGHGGRPAPGDPLRAARRRPRPPTRSPRPGPARASTDAAVAAMVAATHVEQKRRRAGTHLPPATPSAPPAPVPAPKKDKPAGKPAKPAAPAPAPKPAPARKEKQLARRKKGVDPPPPPASTPGPTPPIATATDVLDEMSAPTVDVQF
nr:uncharacterized protein LOC127334920 [Lolium perenne]